jgi:outer membrane protein assembly factor BamD (BamD/ComL family)
MRTIQTTAILAALLLAGCAPRVQQTVAGDDSSTERVSQKTTFSLDKDDALLDKGREAAASGDFATAESAYDELYRSTSAKAEKRAQALFLRGSVQSNLLNPDRDPDAALASYQAVVDEFPTSEWRDDAEHAIASLRGTRGN